MLNPWLNVSGLVALCLASFGMTLLGNFQVWVCVVSSCGLRGFAWLLKLRMPGCTPALLVPALPPLPAPKGAPAMCGDEGTRFFMYFTHAWPAESQRREPPEPPEPWGLVQMAVGDQTELEVCSCICASRCTAARAELAGS